MPVNIIYYGISREIFIFAVMMILMVIIVGHFELARLVLVNNLMRALGKISFEASLIFPIVILNFYAS